ncbi:hypothetical protein K457DRAFT_121188 [Linnemannia elongata AG-77]|uniref:Swiss Army Knife RNA repair protein HAD domain-containing protein n=1 Tax=Linnemannia elongata AG-77 TaxID=1314771 RepID=A0A197KBW8_9FUNG|nr:hypothetical protein K457DRAFT_121188 [Linnemannia elongata AG-77]
MGLKTTDNDETCSIASDISNTDTDRIIRSTFPSPSPPNSPFPATFSNMDNNNGSNTYSNSTTNNNTNKEDDPVSEKEDYSLLTHPAIVFASKRLSDSNYVSRFHTVNVFDFDQTLFQSPLPNPALWDPSFIGILTSWAYCGTGWWHNPGTLEMGPEIEASLWDGWWNEAIVAKVRESSEDPGCLTILLTGRNGPTFGQKLVSMVQSKALDFDLIVAKPTTVALLDPSPSSASKKVDKKAPASSKPVEKYLKVHTFNTKHDFLYNVLYEYPAIRTMHLWDDRPCQIAKFHQAGQEWLDKKMLDHFEITIVQEPMIYLDPQREIDLVLAMVEANNRQVDIEEQGGPFLVPGVGAVPRTRPELRDRKIWDPYETYVPQKRHRIEVTRVVRYTGVMFSEAVQRIMRDKLGGSHPQDRQYQQLQHYHDHHYNDNDVHDAKPWVDRPLVLRDQDLGKWVIPDDLHVTLCLGTGTPELLESIGGLGATVLVEVESVGELENRIWALKVKEMKMGVLSDNGEGGDGEQEGQDDDTREVRIVAPNGHLYFSLDALRAAYISRPSTAISLSSSPMSTPSTRTPSIQDQEAILSSSHGVGDIPLDLVDLDRLGHIVLKKVDTAPHITMAYDKLNGTRAMDSGKITQWESLTDADGHPYPYRLVFVGTVAEKMLLGMKARKTAAVTKAEVSLGNLIKSLTGDKTITGKELGEMVQAVKEEMEKLSVENRLANEERIMTIVHDLCDRYETKKLLSHHNVASASTMPMPTIAIQE